MKTAISYFSQAIEKDPAYAPAYAGVADAYAVLPNYSQTPGKEAYAKAEAAAEKALEIDDSLAEAHISLANVRLWHRWGNGAEPELSAVLNWIRTTRPVINGHRSTCRLMGGMGKRLRRWKRPKSSILFQ